MDTSERSPEPANVTRILEQLSAGAPEADTRLLEIVYGELKRIAGARMAVQAPGHTLQPTALVHEAYMRLLGGMASGAAFRDSAHFFTAASAAMRSILVDHARRKGARKRGGEAARVDLPPDLVSGADPFERILQVHEALELLTASHARVGRTVELLFFAGLSQSEAAGVLGVSQSTVERDWCFGRAWLLRIIEEG